MLKARFGREILVILLIKLTLLYGLWSACFKNNKQNLSSGVFATQIYGASVN